MQLRVARLLRSRARGLKPDDRLEPSVWPRSEFDLAPIRSYEPMDDREPESEAPVSSARAPEAVERAVDLSVRHSRAAIADRDLDPHPRPGSSDVHARARG